MIQVHMLVCENSWLKGIHDLFCDALSVADGRSIGESWIGKDQYTFPSIYLEVWQKQWQHH
jgi:hypothetical protein